MGWSALPVPAGRPRPGHSGRLANRYGLGRATIVELFLVVGSVEIICRAWAGHTDLAYPKP
jgi:hypothetical protein